MGFRWRHFQSEMERAESAINLYRFFGHESFAEPQSGSPFRMRLRPVFLALVCAALAWSAQAQNDPQSDQPADASQANPQVARDQFQEGLERQCPEKQLQLLSSRDLSDGLDQYKSGLPADVRQRLVKSETDHCSSLEAGAACVNLADIAQAGAEGRMEELVTSICTTFLRCRDAGQCDYAR